MFRNPTPPTTPPNPPQPQLETDRHQLPLLRLGLCSRNEAVRYARARLRVPRSAAGAAPGPLRLDRPRHRPGRGLGQILVEGQPAQSAAVGRLRGV